MRRGNNDIVNFRSYGKYASSNYGVNSLELTDKDGNTYYFSYQTVVAVFVSGHGLIIRENDWGQTTGKHLNWIDTDKSKRLPSSVFISELHEFGITVE